MIERTTVKVQTNAAQLATLAEAGISAADLSCFRIRFVSEEVEKHVAGLIKEAVTPLVDKIAGALSAAGESEENIQSVCDAFAANIDNFKLDAGSGFTNNHKAALLSAGCPDVWSKEAGTAKPSASAVSIEL